jgi:hypothetical protein
MSIARLALSLIAVVPVAGCSSATTSPSTPAGNSYTISGTVVAVVDGVRQSQSRNFLLDADYSVSVTLTSAVETMLDGTTLSTVVMGVSLGFVSDGVCKAIPGAAVTVAGSSAVQLVWIMPAGTDCLQISDATTQEGPVAYSASISYK